MKCKSKTFDEGCRGISRVKLLSDQLRLDKPCSDSTCFEKFRLEYYVSFINSASELLCLLIVRTLV